MVTELLIVAGVLGLLGFFEPCTVATHTLFAARTHADAHRTRALAQLLAARSLLLALAFMTAAALGLAELPG